jgi:CBS domain-containing protein
MATAVREVMTKDIVTLDLSHSAAEAARQMRDADIGAIVVTKNGQFFGIVTDRDIVIRCVAENRNPSETTLAQISSHSSLRTLGPDDELGDAVRLVKQQAVRRIPVISEGNAVGIVSLGDLAQLLDPESALGRVSSASPNH